MASSFSSGLTLANTSSKFKCSKILFEMKSFNLLQVQMKWLGILPWHSNKNGKVIRLCLNCVIYGIILEFILMSFWYFAFTAQTLNEYANSFYILTFGIVLFAWYSTYLRHRDNFNMLFLDLDGIIRKSKDNVQVQSIND